MGVCVGQLYESRYGRLWAVIDDTPAGWVLERRGRRIVRTTRELRRGDLWRLIVTRGAT
jgi:hypothetical protein